MGRGHGSGRGASAKAGGFQGDASMRGMSAGLAKALLEREEQIRYEVKNERNSIFDENGNELFRNDRGGRTGASLGKDRTIIENNIITHSHPKYDKRGNVRSDGGGSLSAGDVEAALLNNAREIRAVTERYTYSLKRPKSGWHNETVIAGRVFRDTQSYAGISNRVRAARQKYIDNYKGDKEVARRRSFAVIAHQIMKAFAKAEGYEYTKTKVH